MYAKIENNIVVLETDSASVGFLPVNDFVPVFDKNTHKLGHAYFVVGLDSVDKIRDIIPLTPEELANKARELYNRKCNHGKQIAADCGYLLSKKNIELQKANSFIDGMMTNVIPVKNLLEVGSLARSRQVIILLQGVYGIDYASIFQEAINSIDGFIE